MSGVYAHAKLMMFLQQPFPSKKKINKKGKKERVERGIGGEEETLQIKEAIVKKDANIAELMRRQEKEVRELKAKLNAQTTSNANHNSYSSMMNRESKEPDSQSNTVGNCVRRGATTAGKTRGASFRRY
ncbi:hypothetical protein ACTXT7_001206 [Hymenolepis weldensis]